MRVGLWAGLLIALVFYAITSIQEWTATERLQAQKNEVQVLVPNEQSTNDLDDTSLGIGQEATCDNKLGKYKLQATCQDVCGVCVFVPRGTDGSTVSCRECL